MQVLLGPGQQSEARGISQVFCAWHQLLETLVVKGGTTSCGGCLTQRFFLTWLLGAELLLLLTATACDGYSLSSPSSMKPPPRCCPPAALHPEHLDRSPWWGEQGVDFGVVSFLLALASCGCITACILRICSAMGRTQASSTCSTHILAVSECHSAIIVIYTYTRPTCSARGTRTSWCR
ncbi:Olfactory receptor 13A1 [Camelus dromedarius]|uniref:Olfactory receptor 13A1 n=1 Tax=Camelus dromedarius TaxID=9838 RepID=A0A5N4C8T1_CAMDR|nr:Olfactory receptor 13A1 [Camelus dromedarius]